MQIYSPIQFTAAQQQSIRDAIGADQITFAAAGALNRTDFEQAEVVFGSIPPEWIKESKSLRFVQLDSTGFAPYRALDWKLLGARMTLCNLGGFFAEPVAETALAGLIALLRGVDVLVRLQPERQWKCAPIRTKLRSLHRAVVLIAGFGAIGRRIAQLLEPFHCRVISYAPHAADATIHQPGELDAILPECDVVIAAMPETPTTIGLFNAERLAQLKAGAYLVNVGRGSAVDETALLQHLQSGKLAGAVLDVTTIEPLPPEHPLWTAPNCILTQHTAGGGNDELDRKIGFFLDNLRRYKSGERLVSIVDWVKGY